MTKATQAKAKTLTALRDVAAEQLELSNVTSLPPLDAPALNASEPARSYKVDFSDKSQWFASEDGGLTKAATGSAAVCGTVVDLVLQVSRAEYRDGSDYRLRLAFYEDGGMLSELNLNAINVDRDGNPYVTSPARSLCGALLAISEAEEDMMAFCEGARFSLRPGRGKGVFVEADLAYQGQWIGMASPSNTNRIAKDLDGFLAQFSLIKSRFRGAGLLLTSAALSGDEVEATVAIEVEAEEA